MTYIEPLPARTAGLFVKLVYWFARRRLGRLPAPVGIMAHNRAVLSAVASFELAFERATALDMRLKELATLKTAMLVGCRFCIDIGTSLAQKHGVSVAALMDLPYYETSPLYTPLERRVLDYTVAMTSTPMVMQKALVDALRAELGVAALVELTAAISWENQRARFNHAVGAREEGFSDQTVCLLPRADAAPGEVVIP
ncbi:MAG TPA: carboxymuconolactone decarboxylase family protein [Polyangiaceae bacterium]|nr:carboxymuconolactone decarboxylase family protein [Polyangiaceae bacterium]